jgi:hypothetical protein
VPGGERMTPQHLQALDRGNEIRLAMAARRRELRALPNAEGRQLAAEWLEDPDEVIGRMKLGYLLASIRRMGPQRIATLLRPIGLESAQSRRIASRTSSDWGALPLTLRQRLTVAAALVGGRDA